MERGKHFQSNRRTRSHLDALSELIGKHGLTALLRLAGLQGWIDHPPPHDDAFGVDFADMAALSATLEGMYGPHGGRALGARVGRALFRAEQAQIEADLEPVDAAFKAQPASARVNGVLHAVAKATRRHTHSDVEVEEKEGAFLVHVKPCPLCWGIREADHPICHSTTGFLQQAIEWIGAGDDYRVEEVSCATIRPGEEDACVFAVIRLQ
jgi:predicted hydrocarbon binding protein